MELGVRPSFERRCNAAQRRERAEAVHHDARPQQLPTRCVEHDAEYGKGALSGGVCEPEGLHVYRERSVGAEALALRSADQVIFGSDRTQVGGYAEFSERVHECARAGNRPHAGRAAELRRDHDITRHERRIDTAA